ncbi:MAG TPA: S-adenosylmethionine:tRNA ribosyltransferase-isomerase [Bacteroidales bacterium]|nr:S-adenosylmethionine:tRNA ribosyltransferase-isomerase [Bacteroidales bacterium]
MFESHINIDDYDYNLPDERIAQYPVERRDSSRLLVMKKGEISQDLFSNIDKYLPDKSLLVFNNSKVVKARLLFGKDTGAKIEVFCLEPEVPSGYEMSFRSSSPVEWKCIIGNLKKWKKGIIRTSFVHNGATRYLEAEKTKQGDGETWIIRFTWDSCISFAEVLEAAGHIPLPPYIERPDETLDADRYQTVYSRMEGSVAAPTAGLHFTSNVLENLKDNGIKMTELTLHVGAGTFQPVKVKNATDHKMHYEHFLVTQDTVKSLVANEGKIIAVGTTSVRTIESLYWLGIKLINKSQGDCSKLILGQWDAYKIKTEIPANEALNAILLMMKEKKVLSLYASTGIMIIPGYKYRVVNGIITNFHQPRSTLLLLVSAWIGDRWKEAYSYALENNFRFLSYGDSSLLFP